MKYICILAACLLLGALGNSLRGAEELRNSEGQRGSSFVLLTDLAVVQGQVKEEPGRIVIVLEGDATIRLPRERVACWAESMEGLYRFQVDQRKRDHVDEHLALARWCIRNQLYSAAAHEIVAANRKVPQHPEAIRLEDQLRAELAAPNVPKNDSVSEPDGAVEPEVEEPAFEFASLGESVRREFGVQIQPLLINTCGTAACHGQGSMTAFRIQGPVNGQSRVNANYTQQNFSSTLKWIDREQPQASPLLVRALKAHGGLVSAPLGARQQSAVDQLNHWVELLKNETAQQLSAESQIASNQIRSELPTGDSVEARRSPGTPIRLPSVDDPFDPEQFNRRYHPDRKY